jgi:hypothetical protein
MKNILDNLLCAFRKQKKLNDIYNLYKRWNLCLVIYKNM